MTNPLDQPLENDISDELKERKTGFGKTTIVLGVAVLAIVAFVGGVFVQKSFGASQTPGQNLAGRQFNGGTPRRVRTGPTVATSGAAPSERSTASKARRSM